MNYSRHTGNSNWYIAEQADKSLWFIVFGMHRAGECCQTSGKEVTNLLLSAKKKKKSSKSRRCLLFFPINISIFSFFATQQKASGFKQGQKKERNEVRRRLRFRQKHKHFDSGVCKAEGVGSGPCTVPTLSPGSPWLQVSRSTSPERRASGRSTEPPAERPSRAEESRRGFSMRASEPRLGCLFNKV